MACIPLSLRVSTHKMICLWSDVPMGVNSCSDVADTVGYMCVSGMPRGGGYNLTRLSTVISSEGEHLNTMWEQQ